MNKDFQPDTRNLKPDTKAHALIHLAAPRQRPH